MKMVVLQIDFVTGADLVELHSLLDVGFLDENFAQLWNNFQAVIYEFNGDAENVTICYLVNLMI